MVRILGPEIAPHGLDERMPLREEGDCCGSQSVFCFSHWPSTQPFTVARYVLLVVGLSGFEGGWEGGLGGWDRVLTPHEIATPSRKNECRAPETRKRGGIC